MGTGFFTSLSQSGFVGQTIVVALLFVSVYSWAIIFYKHSSIGRAVRRSTALREQFRADPDGTINHYSDRSRFDESPFSAVLDAALQELALLFGPKGPASGRGELSLVHVDGIERSLERTVADQVIELKKSLIVLATTAGVAPFVGLFGTVWGIMKAFAAMSVTGSASISSVAPGVSAALTTTVAGLAVAIPALIGYNYLMNRVRNLTIGMENFSSEIVSTVERNFG
ncbi:MAG: MotA/TolQ/ExbB proton channel family protein [Candidatus Eisenbacteria bacterium]